MSMSLKTHPLCPPHERFIYKHSFSGTDRLSDFVWWKICTSALKDPRRYKTYKILGTRKIKNHKAF